MRITKIWVEKLSKEEQLELWEKAKNGDSDALTRLLFSMKGLIITIAKFYGIFREEDLEDIVQEAMLTIIEKFKKFDPSKDVKPSTYFEKWIRLAVQQWISRNKGIAHIPWQVRIGIAATGPRPTKKLLLSIAETLDIKPQTLLNAVQVLTRPVSLDAPIKSNGEKSGLWESVITYENVDPEIIGIKSKAQDVILEAIEEVLTEREKLIIVLRYGFDGKERKTLKKVAQEINLSQERTRQIENRALKKLKQHFERHPSKLSLLQRAFS
ncbi:sigma-70 family RNA polymerase sigma factor [bacterium]|nr:sigma-70 family RNA polymerase sigma factor [bacterium]